MKLLTILFMLELEQCLEHVYFDLYQYTNSISEKFKYFVSYLCQNCIMNKLEAVTLRKIYNKNSFTECELIIYASNNIVCNALHEK